MHYNNYEKLVNTFLSSSQVTHDQEGIGTYIKSERLAQGLNQDFVCKDICSISYYSRIENNHIRPSKQQVDDLLRKLKRKLPIVEQDNSKMVYIVESFLRAIINQNHEIIEHIYLSVHAIESTFKKLLMELLYSNYQKDGPNGRIIIKKITQFQNNISKVDLEYLLFAISEHYFITKDYQRTTDFLSLLIRLSSDDAIYSGRLYYIYAKALSRQNLSIKALYYINKADRVFKERCDIGDIVKVKIFTGTELTKHYPNQAIRIFNDLILRTNIKHQHPLYILCLYKLAIVYKHLKDYEKSLDYFNLIIYDTNQSMMTAEMTINYIDLLILLEEHEQAIQECERLQSESHLSDTVRHQLLFYQLKLSQKPISEKKEILIQQLIPFAVSRNDFGLEEGWRMYLIHLLDETQQYDTSNQQYRKLLSIYN